MGESRQVFGWPVPAAAGLALGRGLWLPSSGLFNPKVSPSAANPAVSGLRCAVGMQEAGAARRRRRRELGPALLAFVLYALLGLAMTWPLARAPHRLLHGNPDVLGNAWTLSWFAHQLPRDPLRLFDANMFFPCTKSLAYAESLVPQGLQAIAVRALGGSNVLAYNLVLFLTFPLSGLGAALLARDIGASRGASLIAGLGFAFCAYRWDHIVHLQSLSCAWLPFFLLFLRRTLRSGSLATAAGLALFAWLQVLSSGYYALLVAFAGGVVLAWELWPWAGSLGKAAGPPAGLRAAAAALLVAALAAGPVFLQHRTVMKRHGFTRSARETWFWSASLKSWLDPGPDPFLPHARWLHERFEDREPLFPGTVFLGLGLAGVFQARRDRAAGLALLLTATGAVLAFGPEWRAFGLRLPAPAAAVRLLPGGDLLRTPSRFGILAILGLDLLAALVLTRLGAATALGTRARAAGATALAAFCVLEAWPLGLSKIARAAPPNPPSTAWLRDAPRGAVLELPWSGPAEGALYVYWSTGHWQPLVNGFGSFDPRGHLGLGLLGQRFPSEYTARRFRAAGVRYVVLHADRIPERQRVRLLEQPLPEGVALLAELGADHIYGIDAAGPEPRQEEGLLQCH